MGLVLAETVTSHVSLPSFPNSAMDGYAVVAADLEGATVDGPVHLPVIGEIVAGSADVPSITPGRCVRIMTGAPLPVGADAVVPVETTSGDRGQIAFHRAYDTGANVRRVGEDLAPGQPLVAAGRRITPADVALLANAGETRVPCNPPPRVVVLSTGDELVPADDTPGPGMIRDGNGPMLAALVRQAGGTAFSGGIVRDDRKALMYALDSNLGHADLVVCSGGASAGTRDVLPDVIGALGEVSTAKVAMQPGMPQILGRIRDVPIVGLPGNPVSAFVSFEVFVRPALRTMQGRRDVARPRVRAVAVEPMSSPARQALLPAGPARPRRRAVAGGAHRRPGVPHGVVHRARRRPGDRPRGRHRRCRRGPSSTSSCWSTDGGRGGWPGRCRRSRSGGSGTRRLRRADPPRLRRADPPRRPGPGADGRRRGQGRDHQDRGRRGPGPDGAVDGTAAGRRRPAEGRRAAGGPDRRHPGRQAHARPAAAVPPGRAHVGRGRGRGRRRPRGGHHHRAPPSPPTARGSRWRR